uniref:MFS domain-containing protein n=1 Tax=Steinernema glaseri TaxID=37863 RepID=A0A1I7ZVZ8_9BILA
MEAKKVHPGKVYEHRTRYFILFLGMFCLSSICSNMISLNFTLICMHEKNPAGVPHAISANSTENSILNLDISNLSVVPGPEGETVHHSPNFDYTQKEKSMLLWAVACGTLLAAFPFNYLYQYYGAKYVFFCAGLLSAAATAAIPTMAYISLNWFLFARFLQGISYGADFAAIGLITVRWASLKQHGVFISVLTSFSLFSVIITMPVSGFLCENYGWPSVYYAHATFGVLIFSLWLIYYQDDPRTHRSVSSFELEKIERNKSEAHKNHDPYVPYWEILKNPVILTVWLNAFAEILSGQLIVTYGPTYLKEVLKFGVARTGTFVALPIVVQMACKLSSGYLSDQVK